MAHVSFTGNVGDEPELRYLASGDPVIGFSVAENHSRLEKQTNQWNQTGVTWRRVSLFGRKAESLAEVLRKGARVHVSGKEETQAYTNKQNNERQSLRVTAHDVGVIAAQDTQNQAQGGFQAQGGPNTRQGNSGPSQGKSDPWGQSQSQAFDWNATDDQATPY